MYIIQDDANRSNQFTVSHRNARHIGKVAKKLVREGKTSRVSIYGRHISNEGPIAWVEVIRGKATIIRTNYTPKSME